MIKERNLFLFLKYNLILILFFSFFGMLIGYSFFIITKSNDIYLFLILGFTGGLLFIFLLLTLYFRSNNNITLNIYDNIEIYKTPFHKSYFLNSTKVFQKLNNISTLSIILALMLVSKKINLPSGFGELRNSFSFIFFSVGSSIYGPIAGLVLGALSDTLGYYLVDTPSYPFNPLYTVSAMLTGFVYAVFFYKTKITFVKAFYARIIVNILINAVYGTFCRSIDMGYNFEQALFYFKVTSLPKNIIYLMPQSFILFISFKFLSPVLKSTQLMDERICDNITLF